jgi:hypothetical protein
LENASRKTSEIFGSPFLTVALLFPLTESEGMLLSMICGSAKVPAVVAAIQEAIHDTLVATVGPQLTKPHLETCRKIFGRHPLVFEHTLVA